jgi:methionyl-tRNA synthetase
MSKRLYITTAIPYVNGDPHLGHALELVQADVLARHRRLRGDAVRFQSGTDDNALKNVDAALAAGRPVAEFVEGKADRFVELARQLGVSNDDFIRTSTDSRHRPGVERLWRACVEAGDLYERDYEGLYCAGCEAFVEGTCPEHDRPPEHVSERNWFFRLSGYQEALLDLIRRGELRIEPAQRRNEVLAFVESGLRDFSVSRARKRAHGWGISVPGDPSQVVYVWFDALANYVTALEYGAGGAPYDRWWRGADERLHVIGKGIVRFHAVYWPAILLSAGEPLPTTIFVHDYITSGDRKLSKSLGAGDAFSALGRFGGEALRWWFLRDVPRSGDAEFREERVAARANELADGLGNLVNRTVSLLREPPRGERPPEAERLLAEVASLPEEIDAAFADFDFRAATQALSERVGAANRFVSVTRPWELAGTERAGVLGVVVEAIGAVARELAPFLPDAARRIARVVDGLDAGQGRRLFPKFEGVA